MTAALKTVDVVRVEGQRRVVRDDRAAAEEPLEIRLHGRSFAVTMRTPGADRELAAGFLLSEQVVRNSDDLGTIEYCPDTQASENVINATLTGGPDAADRALAERRQVMMNSSCGLCGRLTIESLRVAVAPVARGGVVTASAIASLAGTLLGAQAVFGATGGLHAAGLFTLDGVLETSAEDVGRHNAVDKVVGRMLMKEALPLSAFVLFVSGRTSFEIVQKAFIAGIPIVASVSAPSTLAIDLAQEAGITLVGFVRGDTFNIYANPQRIA